MLNNVIVGCYFSFFFLIYEKEEFIKTKQRNYREVGPLASTLIIDSKQGGQQPTSKEPIILCDYLARVWATPLKILGTHFIETSTNWESRRDILEHPR